MTVQIAWSFSPRTEASLDTVLPLGLIPRASRLESCISNDCQPGGGITNPSLPLEENPTEVLPLAVSRNDSLHCVIGTLFVSVRLEIPVDMISANRSGLNQL
jgi:hypothetical protein